jgi:hypothetical protein
MTDIQNPKSEEEISYFPNPTSDNLNLQLPEGDKIITVYNFSGKRIDQLKISESFYKYNMMVLKPGIYIFEILNNNTLNRFKIIKK